MDRPATVPIKKRQRNDIGSPKSDGAENVNPNVRPKRPRVNKKAKKSCPRIATRRIIDHPRLIRKMIKFGLHLPLVVLPHCTVEYSGAKCSGTHIVRGNTYCSHNCLVSVMQEPGTDKLIRTYCCLQRAPYLDPKRAAHMMSNNYIYSAFNEIAAPIDLNAVYECDLGDYARYFEKKGIVGKRVSHPAHMLLEKRYDRPPVRY
jgi:hypothetical protein